MITQILPQEELERISREFYSPEWDNYSEEKKQQIYDSYRKVEKQTNESIERYGSVEKWYESGEGRLLES